MAFLNRADAGRQLADTLRSRRSPTTVIVGVTNGGVPIAAELASILDVPLDICVVRKLVVKRPTPLTIGAVAEGGATSLDSPLMGHFAVTASELGEVLHREAAEVVRLAQLLRSRPPLDLRDHDVILVDDGALTGATLRAAAFALSTRRLHSLDLAVPVGATHVVDSLRADFDRVTCLECEPDLVAIGARYADFPPVSEAEIITLLEVAARGGDRLAV
ncbi:MAG TPA: phosphoribosyltransferase family protein [Kofleriaceae bacterium]